MMRRVSAAAALLVLAWAGAAAAEEGEEISPSELAAERAEPTVEHPVGLPPSAINWSDFNYQNDAEQFVDQYHVEPGPPIVAQVINFLILIGIIYLIARKPLSAYLRGRSDRVREGLVEAQRLLEEANERLADYSARLERMDEEMTRLKEEFVAAGVAERDRLVADAGAKAERLRREADLRLQQEFSQLREELRVEVIEKAVRSATEVLTKQVNEADQKRLADDYVGRIEQEGLGR